VRRSSPNPIGRAARAGVVLSVCLMLMPAGTWLGGVSSALGQARQDVEIELEQFGVGSALRPGDMTAIRLRLTSNLTEAIQVWVQWEVPNADGDIGEYGRSLSLTPGRPSPVWLYAPVMPEPADVWTVRVFAERDGERREELGGTRIGPGDATRGGGIRVPTIAGMIAVIGRYPMGLDDFRYLDAMMDRPYSAHEQTLTISNLSPVDCPDRWFGWLPFEAIVWGDPDNEPPQDLGTDRADAIRDYIFRGGHLVIILPDAGNPWGIGQTGNVTTELTDLLPQVPLRRDVMQLAELLPALSKIDKSLDDAQLSVQVFAEIGGQFDAIDGSGYDPLITLADGRVIAVQRLYGHGRITILGVDVASDRLNSIRLANGTAGLPQADALWNRILGRRADMPTSTMLALVLFAVYWLVAGPGGFALLKQYGRTQHSWLAFAGAAGAFTAVAWGAVSLLPSDLPEVKHLTILDHVAHPRWDLSARTREQQLQRATSYFSVYLDEYRQSPVAIASEPGQHDLLHSWTAAGVDSRRFPNVDHYRVDVGRNAANYLIPARSTATQMVAYWTGANPNWGGMLRETDDQPIQVTVDASGQERLSGSVMHSLPGDLTDVTVIWITSQRVPRRMYYKSGEVWEAWVVHGHSGRVLNRGYMSRPPPLSPNVAYPVGTLISADPPNGLERNIEDRLVAGYAERELIPSSTAIRDDDMRNYMEMLSIYHQLSPPPYLLTGPNAQGEPIANFTRELGRTHDLSAWFTRPCLIVIGYLERSPTPVPLRLKGREDPPSSEGRTMYRWIFPLPLNENIAFGSEDEP
jgi:hypothetical protein